MRYALISKGLPLEQIEAEARKAGGINIKTARLLNQVFCELDAGQVQRLSRTAGLVLKEVKEVRPTVVMAPEAVASQTVLTPQAVSVWDVFQELRSLFVPPLTGSGLTVAVLDSGIRKSHRSLVSRVVYEANFTESPGAGDVFGHGTQVAFVTCGCDPEGDAGVAPGAKVMNIKVLSDEGIGSEETVVDGIEEVIELVEEAMRNGTHPTADMFPNVINLSLGSEDDGDPDNPVRIACRQASQQYGIDVISAVGNAGPKLSTIMLPACDEEVIAVGAVNTGGFDIWEKSARGPTLDGTTKPDFCFWGTDLEMASSKSDDEYVAKSGTSFAAPMLSGIGGLLWEVTRRSYGQDALFRWTSARQFAPYYCTKPQEAPLKKDNSYGFGVPAMSVMAGQITQVQDPMQQTVETFPMLMMMGMMGVMIRGVF
ncbi:S8 family serine peptidase [Chloroflexota bacterium]